MPADAIDVFGDAERLQQIVLNLVGNAIKFTPPDGSVAVTVAASAERIILRVHLVEVHGGAVRAESAGAGKGALFTVELPRLASQEAPAA